MTFPPLLKNTLLTAVLLFFFGCASQGIDEKKIPVPEKNSSFPSPSQECPIKRETKIIRGHSMEPALHPDQEISALMGYYVCHTPQKGDIVLVSYAGNTSPLIKFVRGVPGDTYAFDEDGDSFHMRVNGETLLNSDGKMYAFSHDDIQEMLKYARVYGKNIPANRYLLLGDGMKESMDSTRFGFLSQSSIIAKVEL